MHRRFAHCFLMLAVLSLPAIAQDQARDDSSEALEATVDNYCQALASRNGTYDHETAELNRALGDALMALGRFDEAGAAFNEALQGLRITDGLYGDSQLPVLECYIETMMSSQDWEQVDRNFYVAMSVIEQSVPVTDPRFEHWVRRFAGWKMEVHRHGLDAGDDKRALEDAVDYYQLLVDSLSADEPDYTDKVIALTREKGLVHYYSAMAISTIPFDEFESRGSKTVGIQSCYTITENGRPVTICETRQAPNPEYFESRQQAKFDALQGHVSAIRGSFRDLIAEFEANPDTDPVDLARTVLTLGDMNYLLQDDLRAKNHYARSFEILDSAGVSAEARHELMGTPTEIARSIIVEAGVDVMSHETAPTGLVSFDVTADGTIHNLGITGTGEDLAEANQLLITERLRQSVYRPRLEAGEPVDARLENVPAAQL